jgi:hypothetical protein
MSASSREVAWDRRRGDRRAETSARDRRRTESPAGAFEAYLDVKLGELERTAAVTAAEIKAEARNFQTGTESDRFAAETVDGIAQRVSRAIEQVAQDVSRVRGQLDIAKENGNGEAAPSQGAELLVRQMAIAGADASEIEQELENLGMDHPRSAIDAVLAERH